MLNNCKGCAIIQIRNSAPFIYNKKECTHDELFKQLHTASF